MKKLLLATLVAAAAFVPRVSSTDRTVTFDETLWLARSRAFTGAIGDARFGATVGSGHPGVTTMWASGLAQTTLRPGAGVRARLARSRVFLAVGAAGLIVLAWWIAIGLAGTAGATLGALLVALDPFTVAHNRLVHIDGLLALAMLSSFLALLRAARSGDRRWLVASGVLGGAAVLTKVAGTFCAAAAVAVLVRAGRSDARRRIALWLGAAAATVVALWPAFWVAPWKPVAKMLVGAGGAASANPGGRLLGGGPVVDSILFYPAVAVWRTTIVTLPLIVAATIWARGRRHGEGREAAALLLFALGVGVFTAAGLKRADRYLLPALVAAQMAAGFALSAFLHGRARAVAAAAIVAALALHAAPGLALHPNELASFNWAAGGPVTAKRVFALGFGEGLDVAAAMLNALPGAERLTVGSTHLSPFRELFAGRTVRLADSDLVRPGGDPVDLVLFYISSAQTGRYATDAALFQRFRDTPPLRTVEINGIPYVRVYAAG